MGSNRSSRLAVLLWVGVLLLSLPARSLAQASSWSEPISLSSQYPQSLFPDIAADQAGNLYVVWSVFLEARETGWGDGIAFSMWDGKAWSSPIDILGRELSHLPSIAIDSQGRLHLIGVGFVGLGYSHSWAQERPASGRAWSAPVDISAGLSGVYWNDIAVDSHDWIHVVYSDQTPSHDRQISNGQCIGEDCSWVFYTRSTDGGQHWSTPVKISPVMAAGPRVQLAIDHQDRLYVVWSNEFYQSGSAFVPSMHGFVYSTDGGQTWSEPETQFLYAGKKPEETARLDYWLSVAVDNKQTIHVVTSGGTIRHIYREGLTGPWIEDAVPALNVQGLNYGYGFRGIAVDASDNLHLILPTFQFYSQTPPGLFHAVWSKASGWSDWTRATTNTRGKGCGLGNVAVSMGNELQVVWFEHLEGSSGHLFKEPRGRIEVYYARLQTDAQAFSPIPLPTLPPPPTATATAEVIATPAVTATMTAMTPASPISAPFNPEVLGTPPISGPAVGMGLAALFVAATTLIVVLWRRRKRARM